MFTEELLLQAKSLPPAEQVDLIEALMNQLDRVDHGVELEWATEARDRLSAYRQGTLRAIPLEQVLEKYGAR